MKETATDRQPLAPVLIQLYRGEVARSDSWRARLDSTTNWALTTTAAIISFGLGGTDTSHAVFLAGMFLVTSFLFIETGRYRKWDVYLRRVRLLETGLFSPFLRGEPVDHQKLRELATMLDTPRLVVSITVALAQRIRRAYGPMLVVILAAWMMRLSVRPELIGTFEDFVNRAHLGFIPGSMVITIVILFYLFLGLITALSVWFHPPATELRPTRRRKRTLKDVFASSWDDTQSLNP